MPDYIPPPVALKPGSLVWAYLRDSGGDAQEQSVPQQEAEIKAYCDRHGLTLAHVFKDVARSGGSVVNRDAFLDMIDLSDSQAYRPAGLLLWNFARFARDLDDSSYYKATLRKRGLVIHSLTDPIPEGTFGRVVETFIDIANEERRRQISRDVKRSLQSLFRQGFSFGTPPKGYMTEHVQIGQKRDGQARKVGRWVPDPDLWDLVKLAWSMRVEGHTYGEIRDKTHGLIYTAKPSWKSFFENKAYLGIGVWGSLEIPNHHEPAIDLATWEAVQVHQTRTRRPQSGLYHPRTMGNPSLLSGLAYCIHCGSAIIKDRTGKNDWDCYTCGRKRRNGAQSCEARAMNTRSADIAIIDAVITKVLTPDYAHTLLLETQAKFSNTVDLDKDQERITKTLAELNQGISRLLDLAEKHGPTSDIMDRLKEREIQRAKLDLDRQQIECNRQAAQVEITPEALALALAAWRGEINATSQSGNIRALKGLLTRFVTKIDLGYNTARIWYSFPFEALYGKGLFPLGGTRN